MLLGFVYIGSTHYKNNWFHSKFSDEINYSFSCQVGENTCFWETKKDNAKQRREFVLFVQGDKFKQLRPWTPNSHFRSLACLRDLVLVTHKKGTRETQRAQQLLKNIEGLSRPLAFSHVSESLSLGPATFGFEDSVFSILGGWVLNNADN